MGIQSVSNKTLMEILKDFNEIIRKGAGVDAQPGGSAEEEKQMRTEELEAELENAHAALEQYEQQLSGAQLPTYESLEGIELLEYDELSPKSKMNCLEQRVREAKQRIKSLEKQCKMHQVTCRAHDPFYGSRGVDLISVEVLKFSCSNRDTDLTLQQIIKETADRLKKKEYQEGEKVNAFISQLSGDNNVVSKEKAVELYTMLRKVDAINLMSQGKSTMYVTPNDVNLSVGSLYPSAVHGV